MSSPVNEDGFVRDIIESFWALSIPQILTIILGATIILALPPALIRRAKSKAEERGIEVVEDYNSILPFPKQIDTTSKVLVCLCYVLGFVILIFSLGMR